MDLFDKFYAELTNDILNEFPFVESIYIIGSFGRDEGTFKIIDNKLQFFNDIDIIAIIKDEDLNKINQMQIEAFVKYNTNKLNIPYFDFGIQTRSQILKQSYTIHSYDLKYGSKLVYGLDTIAQFEISVSDIPKYEFIRLILNRTAGLLSGKYNDTSEVYNIIQQYKAYIALGDAALFHHFNFYHPSYKVRMNELKSQCQYFEKIWGKSFFQKILAAYQKKLNWDCSFNLDNCEMLKARSLEIIYSMENIDTSKPLRHFYNHLVKSYANKKEISLVKNFVKRLLNKKNYLEEKYILFLLAKPLKKNVSIIDTFFYLILLFNFNLGVNFFSSKKISYLIDSQITKGWFRYCH